MPRKWRSPDRRLLFLALAVYLVAMALLSPFFIYRLYSDSTSYFSLADQYAAGHVQEAINGYWSPLLSWLLIPWVSLGVPPHVATKVLFALIGVVLITVLYALLGRMGIERRLQNWATVTSIPIVLYCSLTLATPDYPLVCCLLVYIYLFSNPRFLESKSSGLLCGLVGGIAYLCKHYALAFFAAHYTAAMCLWYWQERRSQLGVRVIAHYLAGMVVFGVISSAWVGAMSVKYGELTISQAGKYNHALVGSKFSRKHELRPPVSPHALSAWVNPAAVKQPSWNPLGRWELVSRKSAQIIRTIRRAGMTCLAFTLFAPLIVIGAGVNAWKERKADFKVGSGFLLGTLLLYLLGYVLISVFEERYIWICWFLMLLMVTTLLNGWLQRTHVLSGRVSILLLLLSLSFWAEPAYQIATQAKEGRDLYEISQKLREAGVTDGRLATVDRWRETLYLAYYLDLPYYGRARPDSTTAELAAELQEHKIDYCLQWIDYSKDTRDEGSRQTPPGKEITEGSIPHLRVYVPAQDDDWFAGQVEIKEIKTTSTRNTDDE